MVGADMSEEGDEAARLWRRLSSDTDARVASKTGRSAWGMNMNIEAVDN